MSEHRGRIERTDDRFMGWEVVYDSPRRDRGFATSTLHVTKLGARISRWMAEPRRKAR